MHAMIDDLTSQMQSLRQRRFDLGSDVEEKENQVRILRREMNALQNEIHSLDLSFNETKSGNGS